MRRRDVSARVLAFVALSALGAACGWSPSRPFEREAPAVKVAVRELRDGGDASLAMTTLEGYLSTGPCSDGNIGTPELLRRRADGTFDLGLALFKVGEAFGRRFGEEELDAGGSDGKDKRAGVVGCAVRIAAEAETDEAIPIELRARARYLEGNLNFLDGKYEEAVRAYDRALTLAPGGDAGDAVGRDAAWNRAIALRRIEDNKKKDAGHDASQDAKNDARHDASSEAGHDSGKPDAGGDSGGKNGGPPDAGHDSGGGDSGKPDAGKPPPAQGDSGAPPPPPKANEDERMLDQLESAPTVQQEAAKKMAAKHRVRGMADK